MPEIEKMPWPNFVREFFRSFEQGQHVLTMAQNGSGKTYLNKSLLLNALNLGAHEVVIWTKPRDKELDSFYQDAAAKKIMLKNAEYDFKHPKHRLVFVRPVAETMRGLRAMQEDIISDVLDKVWNSSNWFIYLDELRYLVQQLGLSKEVQIAYTQMRSSGVTIFATIQRPAWSTQESLTESKHVFIGPISGVEDQNTVIKMYGKSVAESAHKLAKREFIYRGPEFSAIVKVS